MLAASLPSRRAALLFQRNKKRRSAAGPSSEGVGELRPLVVSSLFSSRDLATASRSATLLSIPELDGAPPGQNEVRTRGNLRDLPEEFARERAVARLCRAASRSTAGLGSPERAAFSSISGDCSPRWSGTLARRGVAGRGRCLERPPLRPAATDPSSDPPLRRRETEKRKAS